MLASYTVDGSGSSRRQQASCPHGEIATAAWFVVQKRAAARLVARFAPRRRDRKVFIRNKNQYTDAKLAGEK